MLVQRLGGGARGSFQRTRFGQRTKLLYSYITDDVKHAPLQSGGLRLSRWLNATADKPANQPHYFGVQLTPAR